MKIARFSYYQWKIDRYIRHIPMFIQGLFHKKHGWVDDYAEWIWINDKMVNMKDVLRD